MIFEIHIPEAGQKNGYTYRLLSLEPFDLLVNTSGTSEFFRRSAFKSVSMIRKNANREKICQDKTICTVLLDAIKKMELKAKLQ